VPNLNPLHFYFSEHIKALVYQIKTEKWDTLFHVIWDPAAQIKDNHEDGCLLGCSAV
jgi:hypothetical protein